MAEQVQAILERMVPPLKDLRSRGIFTDAEVRKIVERRRRAEYALQRRGGAALLSDYLRYIDDEVNLERLRKLRKEKVMSEMREERRERRRRRGQATTADNDDDGEEEDNNPRHAYKTSGPGDSHIVSHVHFLYQRTLRKFHHPLDVLLNYAHFARECKSFHVLSRIYAEGLQHHPREAGLWIESASFEYFGYVAQDYENNNGGGKDGKDGEVNSKVVGSSIRNARVLMQRGLRINGSSAELWLQYFALELHYVQKLRGRREILEGGEDDDEEEEEEGGGEATSLLPARIIIKNAIMAVPHDVRFRLRFVEACGMFPRTGPLEEYVMEGIGRDFGKSVEGWVARISFAEERWRDGKSGKKASGGGGGGVVGFLGEIDDDGEGKNNEDGEDDDEESDDEGQPKKKARLEMSGGFRRCDNDPALVLLGEALEAVPTPRMYLEAARFLRMRIRRLIDSGDDAGADRVGGGEEDDEYDNDVSYLVNEDEDVTVAARRHAALLEEVYERAAREDVASTALILDRVDYLLGVADGPREACVLLSEAVASSAAKDVNDARLWLRWAEISQQMADASTSSSVDAVRALATPSPISILRRALKRTPLHHRRAHTSISTELMRRLMSHEASSPEIHDEPKASFQKLISRFRGALKCSISYVKKMKRDDSTDDVDGEEIGEGTTANVASTILAYMNYTMGTNSEGYTAEDYNAVRSIYTCVLYRSNYGKSCAGKTYEELVAMKSFFDVCFQYEIDSRRRRKASLTSVDALSLKLINSSKRGGGRESAKAWKMRVMKLYETAIDFYASGGGNWSKVTDGYQRDLDNFKYGH